MADVKIIPKIQCDNCGFVQDKINYAERGGFAKNENKYDKPREWGGCTMEGARDADAYGNKERLDMSDLCPRCASNALNGAAAALAVIRNEREGA